METIFPKGFKDVTLLSFLPFWKPAAIFSADPACGFSSFPFGRFQDLFIFRVLKFIPNMFLTIFETEWNFSTRNTRLSVIIVCVFFLC